MRSFIMLLLCLSFNMGKAQTVHKYYMYLTDYRNAHPMSFGGTYMAYSGSDVMDSAFFSTYTILQFYHAFPDAIDTDVQNIFYIETYDSSLVDDLITNYPGIYVSYEDVSNVQLEVLAYYPNDYGSTSPVTNLGAGGSRQDLDYIHAPDAWDITKGSSKIKIGISDHALDTSLPDLLGKVTLTSNAATTTSISHGTSVAAIAAARGNNSSGTVGVCMNCDIVAAPMGGLYGAHIPGSLYEMALLGAKVINFSWLEGTYTNNGNGYLATHQMVIDDIVNNFHVTLVAAAGNRPSFGINDPVNGYYSYAYVNQYGELFVYPASYNNVISVSTVQHDKEWSIPLSTSDPAYCCYNPVNGFEMYVDLEDSPTRDINGMDPFNPIAVNRNGYNLGPTNVDGFQQYNHTLNTKVDIMAPGRQIFMYADFGFNGSEVYVNGTSFASPMVAGTIGLMLSVNECLTPSESEAILKLSAKDIEHMPLNVNFKDFMGAGKLEAGNAVNFVNEMSSGGGNAVIENHIFERFDFKLHKFNNNLTIQNAVFELASVAEFTAKNQIEVLEDTDLHPTTGYIDLNINHHIDITCDWAAKPRPQSKATDVVVNKPFVVLSPNPNNGSFSLYNLTTELLRSSKARIQVVDLNGRNLFDRTIDEKDFESYRISLPNLSSGMYIVKLSSPSYSQQIKFIKQ